MRPVKFTLILLIAICSTLFGTIVNTKHNLSISGTGDITATSQERVCVFCHIPHSAQTGKPLWNRSMPSTAYTMYDSIYLQRANYPMPAELGMTESDPGSISRQCLSCHDGTVAIGSVYLVGGSILGSTLIDMQNVEADGTMPATAPGFIGTDLSIHHPVGIEYDPNIVISLNSDTRTMELKTTADVAASDVKLYEYGGKQYVECASCHDPHTENSKFLRVSSGANHAQNVVGTCTSCHDKTDWTGSVHQTATNQYVDADAAVSTRYGTTTVSDLGCINCHTPHNGEGTPLLRLVEQNTCFQGAASSVSNASCHGVGGAKDIESVLTRSYTHPVIAVNGVHTDLDYLYGTGVPRDPVGSSGISWDDSKHAVCMDCHNPHRAQAGTHTPAGQWYPDAGLGTNLVSNVLKGVPGVEPTWSSGWTQPTTFTTMESATKEYQICMKCHSYWGLGSATGGVNNSGHVSPSDGTTPMTDQAWELNPNNKSAHPIVMSANDRPEDLTVDHTGDGTYTPRELQAEQLLSPWAENYGNNVMYCSDCHGSDDELGGDPRGPHGSNLRYILKGENNFWPAKSDGVTLYTTGDIKNGTDTGLFCKNCHDVQKPHKDWWSTMANKNYSCVTCHVAVPHGSPVSRMIGYSNFPEPYNYQGNSLFIEHYRKSAYNVIQETDVYVQGGCKNNGCHNTDDSANGAYDPNPFP